MKDTYTKEEVLKIAEKEAEIRYPFKTHSFPNDSPYESENIAFKQGYMEGFKLATGESNYVVIEKEKLFLLIPSMYWAGMLTKEGQEHLLEQFGIDLK